MNPETDLDKQDKAEISNYTRTPNMLIFGYHDISPQEKWLYVCLKHLCGKKGTRHLSLRYISEQTGISTGALSKSKHSEGMIIHLHNAGLIHAEIKKPGKGNPQYHITITEVWALNQAFFRSFFGQVEEMESEPVRNSDKPVQNSDRLVHFSDRSVQNSDEPVRISANTNITYKTNQENYKTIKQESGASHSFDAPRTPFENENEYHFYGNKKHLVVNCQIWCRMQNGTCAEYQTAIDNGWHEAETAPRMEAVNTQTATDAIAQPRLEGQDCVPPVSSGQSPVQDAPPLLHGPQTSSLLPSSDGPATPGTSEPGASGGQKPLSLHEDEPHIRPETPAQRKRRIEQREKEIWALVEEKLGTKFSRTHRQSKANTEGMEHLIEDETDDETIKDALGQLSPFWIAQFNVKQFHLMIPGLLAAKAPAHNGKPAPDAQAQAREENAKNWRRAFAEQKALIEAERQALLNKSPLQA